MEAENQMGAEAHGPGLTECKEDCHLKSAETVYSEENKTLSEGEITRKNSLSCLNPYPTREGVLSVGGRVGKSTLLGFKEHYPLIIPKNSHLAELIVRDAHHRPHHSGSAHTLTRVQQAGFWVGGGTRLVKSVTGRCVTCKRLRGSLVCKKWVSYQQSSLNIPLPSLTLGLTVLVLSISTEDVPNCRGTAFASPACTVVQCTRRFWTTCPQTPSSTL